MTEFIEIASAILPGTSGGTNGTGRDIFGYVVPSAAPRMTLTGMVVEKESTNLVPWSERLAGNWTTFPASGAGTTLAGSNALSPDNTLTATLVTDTTTSYRAGAFVNITVSSVAQFYAWSIFAKAGTNDTLQLRTLLNSGTTAIDRSTSFNLTTGTVALAEHTHYGIEAYPNNWYRCWAGLENTGGNTNFQPRFNVGSMAADQGGIYVWGAQAEASRFMTSYIQTSGAAVSRTAEFLSCPTSLLNVSATDGLVLIEAETISNTKSTQCLFGYDDGTDDNAMRLTLYPNSADTTIAVNFATTVAGVIVNSMALGNISPNARFQAGFTFTATSFAAFLRGGTSAQTGAGAIPTFNTMRIGTQVNSPYSPFSGIVRKVLHYNQRMPNADLVYHVNGSREDQTWQMALDFEHGELIVDRTLTYEVRAAWETSPLSSLAAAFTHKKLASGYMHAEAAIGLLPDSIVQRITYEREVASLFDRLRIGKCSVVLDNEEGIYSPARNSLVRPHQRVAVKAWNDIGSVYGIFSGWTDRISVSPAPGRRTVLVDCWDSGRFLQKTVHLPMLMNTYTSSLVAEVLANVDFPVSSVDIIMRDAPPFAAFDDISAGDALYNLLEAGAHFSYIDPKGALVIKDRNHDVGATPTGSYSSFMDLTYELNISQMINQVSVSGEGRRVDTQVSTVAWLGDRPEIPSSGYITFFVSYTDYETHEEVPVASLSSVVASEHFYVETVAASGQGTDITSWIGVDVTAFANTALVIVSNAHSAAGTLNHFHLDGYPIRATPAFQAYADNTSTQALYEAVPIEIENNLVPGFNLANDYADYLIKTRGNPEPQVSFSIKNRYPDVLERDLLDVVSLVESNAGVNSWWTIMSARHDIAMVRTVEHSVSYRVSRFIPKPYIILDKDPEGKLDSTRVLGF